MHFTVKYTDEWWLKGVFRNTIPIKLKSQSIVLVKGENLKKSLMGFVSRFLWILKALWIVLSQTNNIWRNLRPEKKKPYVFQDNNMAYKKYWLCYESHGCFYRVKGISHTCYDPKALAPRGHSRYVRSPRPYRNNRDSNI